MSTGTASGFKIYHEEYYSGMYEELAQNVNAFNAASQGGIQLVQADKRGDYEKASFIDHISTLVSRRDTASVSVVTDIAMTQGNQISVKLNRKIGPVANTLDSWRKIGEDAKTMSYLLGKMIAKQKMHNYLESCIRACEAALSGQSDLCYDATSQSTKTMTATYLIEGINKLGDQASNIVCWVMHSKVYFDLMKQALSDKLYEEAGRVVYGGTPGTLGRPVVVTDCDALWVGADSLSTTYQTLGLAVGGIVVTESEAEEIAFERITGLENLVYRLQGEYAFNVGIKGFAWDTTNGGANPTDNNLGLFSNWDLEFAQVKNCAGVRIVTQ